MKAKFKIFCTITVLFIACTNNTVIIKNENKGELHASVRLEQKNQKIFNLDNNTAPQPTYIQLYMGRDKKLYFTFLNKFNNSIYFYDYNSLSFIQKITWERKGSNSIINIAGYHIKSLDSIYLYNKIETEVKLGNANGKILKKMSLKGNTNNKYWCLNYPQYNPQTVTPFIETKNEILLTGFFFGSIPDSLISNFKYTARFNFNLTKLNFDFKYPVELYGSNYNWEGELFTIVYSDLDSSGEKLVLSFPVSHNLYLVDLNNGKYKKVYGGSNSAEAISSLNKYAKRTSNQEILANFLKQDVYAAIKYDKYRKVYYRFLLKALPNNIKNMDWKKKPINVIIMDENFKYLGETIIGTGEEWHWENSFITEEGLNIEYIEKNYDEVNLTLKIFTLRSI